MNVVKDKVFIDEKIRLDFTRWEDCVFKKCEILIKTGDFYAMYCDFQDCTLILQGEAQTIARIMKLFFPEIPIILPEEDPGPLSTRS